MQRRGAERRVGVALGGFRFDRIDGEQGAFQRRLDGSCRGFGLDVELGQLVAANGVECRGEFSALGSRERAVDGPEFLGAEGFDLKLAVADDAQRHGLHAARRTRARQLAPQHRRQREADEIVKRPARQIGIDEGRVDVTRMLHRLQNRLPGDGVEDDALDRLALERPLFLEHLQHMPGNRLALAVGVGGEDQPVVILEGGGDVGKPLGRLAIDLPGHVEILVRAHRSILGREIADMAIGGQDDEVRAEIFVDGFGLGGRFDDDDGHSYPVSQSARLI